MNGLGKAAAFLSLALACPVQAGSLSGASLLAVPMSVRQAGMGEVSPGGNDILRAWSNPALLADQGTKYELAFSGAQIMGERNMAGLGWGQVFDSSWTGGAFASTSGISAREIGADGEETGLTLSHEVVFGGMAFAWRGESLRVGVAGKGVSETVAGVSASAIMGDAGLAIRAGSLVLAAAMRNVGGKLDYSSEVSAKGPAEVRAGAAMEYSGLGITIAGEYVKSSSLAGSAGAGLEWRPAKVLALRGGLVKDLEKDSAAPGITAGLTGEFRGFSFDYALTTHEVGMTNRVSLGCMFGGRRGPVGVEKMGLPLSAPLKTAIPISSTMSSGAGLPVSDRIAAPRPAKPAATRVAPRKKKAVEPAPAQ
jgi:hypothetical protein